MVNIITEIKSIRASNKELRTFGISFSLVAALWASLLLWRGKPIYPYVYGVSLCCLLSALMVPVLLKPLHIVLCSLLKLVQAAVTVVVLAIAFYLVFTPIGIIARLCGKDFLEQSIDQERDSYWIIRSNRETAKEQYEKQW